MHVLRLATWPDFVAPAEALHALYRMNVTYATLFPDLDGLARSLGYELEAVWGRLVEDYEHGESAHTSDDPTST